jgi:hypothetical protein
MLGPEINEIVQFSAQCVGTMSIVLFVFVCLFTLFPLLRYFHFSHFAAIRRYYLDPLRSRLAGHRYTIVHFWFFFLFTQPVDVFLVVSFECHIPKFVLHYGLHDLNFESVVKQAKIQHIEKWLLVDILLEIGSLP